MLGGWVNNVNLIIFLASLRELLPFRRIIRLDGFSDDGAGGVTTLVVLALGGDGRGVFR